MITTVLFDLDGTLLPMDQEKFLQAYMGLLARRMAPKGYEPKGFIQAVWAGTGAMVKNDGTKTNEEVFWQTFAGLMGQRVLEDVPEFEDFYEKDFGKAQPSCGFAPEAAEVIALLKGMGAKCVLATNPLFPATATRQRIGWAGLKAEDFALVTTYEDCRFCKPNPEYYREILTKLGLAPEECLMVGNDVGEDMMAQSLGMKVFLLTDCLINRKGADIEPYPRGGFGELKEFLKENVMR